MNYYSLFQMSFSSWQTKFQIPAVLRRFYLKLQNPFCR
jgi:hypothetical protein